MMLSHQIKGIITLSILLAFIPFIFFFFPPDLMSESPILSKDFSNSTIVEIKKDHEEGGIYFFETGTGLHKLLLQIDEGKSCKEDFPLRNGTKLRLIRKNDCWDVVQIEEIKAATRLALGLQINVNSAGFDDLILIPGIGEKTAQRILDFRNKQGSFKNIEQLKFVSGIKDKKLSVLKKYLYVPVYMKKDL